MGGLDVTEPYLAVGTGFAPVPALAWTGFHALSLTDRKKTLSRAPSYTLNYSQAGRG